jgi:hypothetical protein
VVIAIASCRAEGPLAPARLGTARRSFNARGAIAWRAGGDGEGRKPARGPNPTHARF